MNLQELQSATSAKLIAFDTAEVIPGIVNDTWFLHVTGEAPCLNMDVQLVPLIYIDCPEHWGIEVVGYLRGGFCLTAMKHYDITIPLAGVTGRQGIELIGGNDKRRFDVSGGCS